jgi:mannose-1-phosphate guanylyltransferase
MLHALIMAGGAGTRFWPASRAARPKQLLDLTGGATMIQATVARLAGLVAPANTLVMTNKTLVEPIRAQLPALPAEAVIGEPCKRDTAPCIGLAAKLLLARDPQATMAVMPSDHVIADEKAFREALAYAADLVERDSSRLATFGVKPTYPADSFGYIERGEPIESTRESGCVAYRVVRFREKPSVATAKEFLAAGNFYWNAGIFVWKARTIDEALARFEPKIHERIEAIAATIGKPTYPQALDREFTAIQGKSIDYAVLERDENVIVIEAPFPWDDVGNWQSLSRLRGEDSQGNTIVGKHLGIGTDRTIVRSEGDHLIVTVGVSDLIVVHTPDATLVAHRKDEESLRKITALLAEMGWTEYL